MTHAPQSASRRRLIVLAVGLALIIGLLIFAVTRGADSTTSPPPQPPRGAGSSTGPASAGQPADVDTSADPSPAESAPSSAAATLPPDVADCTEVTAGFVPHRFTIEALGADEEILALNLDEDGNIAAPPFDQPRTASWWSGGPKPGSDRGRALLSIHTYNPSLPPALGNELYEGGRPQLAPGDLIKLYGRDGQVMCYAYTGEHKFWIADYDPESDVMVDYDGDPELGIIICWDFNQATRDWDSRVVFYGAPVVPAS